MDWWSETVKAPSASASAKARERQEILTKPPGSLGKLETLAINFAGWQDRSKPRIEKVEICVFAGDHGGAPERKPGHPSADGSHR